jgi:hypothetical protein
MEGVLLLLGNLLLLVLVRTECVGEGNLLPAVLLLLRLVGALGGVVLGVLLPMLRSIQHLQLVVVVVREVGTFQD